MLAFGRLEIKDRAIRRCGELLRQIPPAKNQHAKAGTHPSRKETAQQAGLSEWQKKSALQVANVPRDEFESAVEFLTNGACCNTDRGA
jgi:hypothetical protein